MSARPPKICNLYLKGSCRFGARCKFEHARASSASPSSRGGSPSTKGGPPPTRGGQRSSPSNVGGQNANVPRDVCRMYWTSGRCDRAFDCSFKHVKGENAPDAAVEGDVGGEANVDFSSVEALAGEAATETQRPSLTPAEAHNYLKPFLANNYQFTNTSRIQGFVRVFASVHNQNKTWVGSDLSRSLRWVLTRHLPQNSDSAQV